MDRKKIVEAILQRHFQSPVFKQKEDLIEWLKSVADMDLMGIAINLGIDTDAILGFKVEIKKLSEMEGK